MPKFPFSRKAQNSNTADEADNQPPSSGEEMSPGERNYLESLERSLKESSSKTARDVQRHQTDRDRQRANFFASQINSLPHKASSLQRQEGPASTTTMASDKHDQKHSYQNDPRYREFYERLKRQQPAQADPVSDYDEDPQPMTLEELERSGWKGEVQQPKATPRPAPARSQPPAASQARPTPQQPARQAPSPQSAPAQSDMEAGVVFKFDDDSVAVYKDAVSGKDYALFYFLEPNGVLSPRGIFLEQYEKQRIGKLPPDVLEQMWQSNRWDRDAVIFHLDRYDFATVIRRLETRTPAENYTRPQPASSPRPVERQERPQTPLPVERDPLERGRVVRINVAGKVWESVYWTKDEIGPIVAHDTNREWSLMHLDLSRFKDSLEYGELLNFDKLQEIEDSLARHSR